MRVEREEGKIIIVQGTNRIEINDLPVAIHLAGTLISQFDIDYKIYDAIKINTHDGQQPG